MGSSKFITRKYKCIIQSLCIVMIWQHISPEVTVKGFKKCCIFSAVDETDDDMPRNGSEKDRNVRCEC